MHAKYIVVKVNGQEVPIVFPDHPCQISHKFVAAGFPQAQLVSGGYCCLETWAAFGEAISVDLKSRGPADTLLLFQHFHGADAATLSTLRSLVEPQH